MQSINKLKLIAIVCSFSIPFVAIIGLNTITNESEGISTQYDFHPVEPIRATIDEPIQPISVELNLNPERVALGEMLFKDPRLSSTDSISCFSCHNLSTSGADRLPRSLGVNGSVGLLNSPTVFNVASNIAHYWDGRAETLLEQIDGPIHNPTEMGSSWPKIVEKLNSDQQYKNLFSNIYPDGITSDNIKNAISTFEQSLVTTSAPFDRFLLGETSAISENAKTGYAKFKEYGCIACHQGSNVGGNLFQPLGIMGDYFGDRGTEIKQSDFGRYNVTGLEEDKFVFRVPSLRLVTLTAPYFHDGSAATLREAVRVMVKYQLGRTASKNDVDLIVEFLHTLVGDYKGKRLSL